MTMPAGNEGAAATPAAGSTPSGSSGADSGSDVTLRDRLAPGMGSDDTGDADERAAKTKAKAKADADKQAEKPKYKYKRGEQELEEDGESLAKKLSDDYEHEFSGPGGKKFKLAWPDIGKRIALSEGAKARMERAA